MDSFHTEQKRIRQNKLQQNGVRQNNMQQKSVQERKDRQPDVVYTRIKYKRRRTGRPAGRKHKKRKLWLLGITAVAFLLLLWGASVEPQARYTPNYAQENIEPYLYKKSLSEEDYRVLFGQTGLSRCAVDELRAEGRESELLVLQDKLFAEVPIRCTANTIVSREERVEENSVEENSLTISAERAVRNGQESYAEIPCVEDGDILITFNAHVFGWRNGHAAIVVDAEQRLTLEARVLGTNSTFMSLDHWRKYPSFAVLRLKDATKEERGKIAEFAKSELLSRPYRLTAGWGDWLYPENMTEGTQCAHLVWLAYQQSGYDLDSDGGLIVTPRDLYESPLLEFVQVYGMPISP